MSDIRQSPLYAQYMQKIGWKVFHIEGIYIYIKPFPLIGATIKLQRADTLPSPKSFEPILKQFSTGGIFFEPGENFVPLTNQKLLTDPFLPTKTIHIDLTPTEETIFKHFSPAKQRGVRRAEKAGLRVTCTDDVTTFIQLKNRSLGLFGFLATATIKQLCLAFSPHNMAIFTAYIKNKPEATVLVVWYEKRAYYWMAAATKEGKKQFAPTLLVWEAFKYAKTHGCTLFDFDGIYDERYPKLNTNWQGFTKFKLGFGGKIIYFPQPVFLRVRGTRVSV